MMNLPSGTVTFLFSDIEGSTRLAQEHPDQWEDLRARHHAILHSVMDAHNGFVFQIVGDAFCVAFHAAHDGVNAAIESQRRLQNEDWGETPIRIRIGIHTGKADLQPSGEYRGYLTLSHVQRLMSAGHGGQILISPVTQELVQHELAEEVLLRDMGEHRLKSFIHTEHIFQVSAPDLLSEFPALNTLDARRDNLPAQLTPFVGRERELAAVLRLLRNPVVRLVTLTGPGGTGKTRLSLQVAAELLDEFQHGIWFVELASITDAELVLPAIASTLKVRDSSETTIEQALQNHLRDQHLLLVLDNFEQVVSAASKISQLLHTAPKIKIMVSSREVLHVRGEHDYPVPPLGLPESKHHQTAAVLAQYESIALFVQHAQAANPAFMLDEDNASVVADICSHLDGLPLAIELAAARSRLLKPAAMLEKLKNKLDLLTGGGRDLPHRQQTIRGALDWSFDLLDDHEKPLFARLGIFVGGWTLEFAESVCGEAGSVDFLNGIESLLDKSLIRKMEASTGESRFSMLETIREYAFEKLSQRDEFQTIRQAHANVLADLVEKVGAAVGASDDAYWFAKLDDELDNLRSAVEWTLANDQPTLTLKSCRSHIYWHTRTNYREPLRWLERAFASRAGVSLVDKAYALNSAGYMYHELYELSRARSCFESALSIFRDVNDRKGVSRSLNHLGNLEYDAKNFEKARQLYEESLTYEERIAWGVVMTSINLGNLARIRGDWEGARNHYLHARDVSERMDSETGISSANSWLGGLELVLRRLPAARECMESVANAAWIRVNPLNHAMVLGWIAGVDLLMGNHSEDVRQRLRQALEAAAEYLNQSPSIIYLWLPLEAQARLHLLDGRMERAAQLFGASRTQREMDNWLLTEFERTDYDACTNAVRTALKDEIFNQLFEKGKSMTIKDALAFALHEDSQ
jgi:predicted ATPase/class 3 adenylate cyclase